VRALERAGAPAQLRRAPLLLTLHLRPRDTPIPRGVGLTPRLCRYHWGTTCFVDRGAGRTGCHSHTQLPYDDGFHTYAAEWDPDGTIRWWYDGAQVFQVDRTSDPDAPLPPPDRMMLIINTALAWWVDPPGAPPGIGDGYTFHYVDWLRAWSRDGEQAPRA
jgi:hypothetical protein